MSAATTARTAGPAAATGSRRAWLTAWLLFGFMLVNFADKTVLGLCADPIMRDLHLTRQQFGTASAAFFALFSVSALLVSLLTRRVRSSLLLAVLAVLWSAAQIPVAAGAGFGALIGTRLLLGAAEGPAAPVAIHHLHGWFPHQRRALPTALLLSGAAGGVALAAPVVTAVMDSWGWRWAFGLVGAAGLVWSALWLRLGREGPPAPDAGPALPPDAAGRVPYRRILLSGTVLSAAFGAFAAYWMLSANLTWMPDYLHDVMGFSTRRTALVTAGVGLVTGLLLLGHGRLTGREASPTARRRLPEVVPVGLLVCTAGACVAGFALSGSTALRMVLLLGPMALATLVLTASQLACARICPPGQRGPVLGAVACVYGLGGVLSPVVTGHLVDAAPTLAAGYRQAFLATAVLVAVAGVLVCVFLRPERDGRRLGSLH